MKFLVFIFLISCSHQQIMKENKLREMRKTHQNKIDACFKQKDFINSKLIDVEDEAFLSKYDTYQVLDKDEKVSMKNIQKLNLDDLAINERYEEENFKVQQCLMEVNDKELVSCENVFGVLNFYQAVIHAVRHYSWSKNAKDQAMLSLLRYIKYIAHNKSSLMENLTAISLLDISEKNKLLPVKFSDDVRLLYLKGQDISLEVNNYVKDNFKDKNNCKQFQKIVVKEKELTGKLQNQLKTLIDQIL